MSQPPVSQNKLFEIVEILASEVEALKDNKKEYDRFLKEINEHLFWLEKLYNKPINGMSEQLERLEKLYQEPVKVDVDMDGIRGEHERIKETLREGMYFSTGLVISFFVLVIGLGISLCCNYEQYKTNRKHYWWLLEARREFDKLKNSSSKSSNKK